MILIGLLGKCFFEHLKSEKFPSSVISVFKKELLNIKQIRFYYNVNEVCLTDLSTLESLCKSLYFYLINHRTNINTLLCITFRYFRNIRTNQFRWNFFSSIFSNEIKLFRMFISKKFALIETLRFKF